MVDVSIYACDSYEKETVHKALEAVLAPVGGLDFVKAGMTVAIKTNLVHASKPEKAVVSHPVVLAELTKMLVQRGAKVIVGDSPGGLYNAAALRSIYHTTGMAAVEESGGSLNRNFSQEDVSYPDGNVLKSFPYTSWLREADVIINVCKLKTHGMMGMSCAAKNLFGVIPGTAKPEFHFRYPNHADFARMILDIDDYVAPVLSICDAVVGMEGNGPTAGVPRQIGCLLASKSMHKLDLAAASIIGLAKENVPTLSAAFERGYIPENADALSIEGDINAFKISDFDNIATDESGLFSPKKHKGVKRILWTVAEKALTSRPMVVKADCVGCGKCRDLCPAKAIVLKKGKAKIDKKSCIRCFCCQEFCPVSAMVVKRTALAKIITKL